MFLNKILFSSPTGGRIINEFKDGEAGWSLMFRISVASKFIDTSVESTIFYIQVITLIILILTKDDDIYFNQKVKQEERYFKIL